MRQLKTFLGHPYVVAVLCVATATAVRLLLDPWMPAGYIFSWYYAAVMVAALRGGWKPAVVALAIGYLAAEWFFVEPRYSWPAFSGPDLVALLTFAAVSLAIAACSEVMRRVPPGFGTWPLDRAAQSILAQWDVDPVEIEDVAAAVRKHELTSQELRPYLIGLSASEGLMEVARLWETRELPPHDVARRLDDLARGFSNAKGLPAHF